MVSIQHIEQEIANWLSMIANGIVMVLAHRKEVGTLIGPYQWIISITAFFQFGSVFAAYLVPYVSYFLPKVDFT